MKYRIVERVDGRYEIQKRRNFFYTWRYVDCYSSEKDANDYIKWIINSEKIIKENEIGMKIKKIIQEIEI